MAQTSAASSDPASSAIAMVISGLETMKTGFILLQKELGPDGSSSEVEFDPKDTRNKYEVGGLEKLTPRGVEICYRLFDRGASRYAVANAMAISFGAATHRLAAWQKAGGIDRAKQPLD